VLTKGKRVYRGLVGWLDRSSSRVDLESLECNLSPIDKYVIYSGILNKKGLFDPSYEGWRVRRLNKILEIYGVDFFAGKKVLELGCGHGDIGAFFADLGADVLCLDGRIQNINFAKLKHRKLANLEFVQFNLENDFSHFGKFDLIIDFGLIYHLRNVETHLKACFAAADDIVMETVVCDSTDPNKVLFCAERREIDEESLEGTGSRPSPFYIERIARENNFNFTRYFTGDLNAGSQFCYDWAHKNDNRLGDDFRLRRFWRLTKAVPAVADAVQLGGAQQGSSHDSQEDQHDLATAYSTTA
jgi:SAM-dependent methyltransferase